MLLGEFRLLLLLLGLQTTLFEASSHSLRVDCLFGDVHQSLGTLHSIFNLASVEKLYRIFDIFNRK